MNLIKRISATVTSSVDRAVSKVENHDAIIEAALKETRTAASRSKVRLNRVQKDGRKLKQRLAEQREQAEQWTGRARRIADTDEAKALECVRRRKACLSQVATLEQALVDHHVLEDKIAANVKKIEARVGDISQQRNMMRSRQSVADAMRVIQNVEGSACGDIEETFDRWEITLGECELDDPEHDPLEASFATDEEAVDLRAELDILLGDDAEHAK